MLDDISLELNEGNINLKHSLLDIDDKKLKIERNKEFNERINKKEKSIITELFYLNIITTYICKCKKELYSFQRMLDIPLLLPENENKTTLSNLLNSYFCEENVNFEERCLKCGKILPHIKKVKISKIPSILIFSLQRLDFMNNVKNNSEVFYPEEIDIQSYIDEECELSKNTLYRLYAVLYHQGDFEFGHYISYIKIFGQHNWYEYNDCIVNNLGAEIDTYSNAYILFYINGQN